MFRHLSQLYKLILRDLIDVGFTRCLSYWPLHGQDLRCMPNKSSRWNEVQNSPSHLYVVRRQSCPSSLCKVNCAFPSSIYNKTSYQFLFIQLDCIVKKHPIEKCECRITLQINCNIRSFGAWRKSY